MIRLVDVLDPIDPRRFDTEAICEAATRFAELPNEEQDEYLNVWDYAGMLEAEHPFTALLRESHNATCVVRDIDGALQLLWQEHSTSDRWLVGPLCSENLIDADSPEDTGFDAAEWIDDEGLSFTVDQLHAALDALPSAPGPVMRF